MQSESIVQAKSMSFAIRIVNLSRYLSEEHKEFVLSKQLLKSGTSIGANISEAEYAQSKIDFTAKMSIALKEAAETKYWIELLRETEYLREEEYRSMKADCVEMIKMLTAVVKRSKEI